jgi:alpha-tubulin suppressor-like RCC1 family protein
MSKISLSPENKSFDSPIGIYNLACGQGFAIACNGDGEYYGVGAICRKSPENRIPLQSLNRTRVIRVFAARDHAMVLSNDGEAWACGLGEFRRLGLGDEQDRAGSCSCADFRRLSMLPLVTLFRFF